MSKRISAALALLLLLYSSANAQFQGYSSSALTSGSVVILGGNNTSVCFDDGGNLNCGQTGFTFTKASNTLALGLAGTSQGALVLNGATAGGVTLAVPASNTSYTLTLPGAVPAQGAIAFFTTAAGQLGSVQLTGLQQDNGTGNPTAYAGTSACSGTTPFLQSLSGTGVGTCAPTSSSPTLAGLTLTSPLTVPNGGTGATTFTANALLKGNTTGALLISNITDTGTSITVGSNGEANVALSTAAASIGTCGTAPSLVGNNVRGTITVGTGTVTSCAVNFSTTLTAAPICVVEDNSTFQAVKNSTTTSALTVTAQTNMAGDSVSYICFE